MSIYDITYCERPAWIKKETRRDTEVNPFVAVNPEVHESREGKRPMALSISVLSRTQRLRHRGRCARAFSQKVESTTHSRIRKVLFPLVPSSLLFSSCVLLSPLSFLHPSSINHSSPQALFGVQPTIRPPLVTLVSVPVPGFRFHLAAVIPPSYRVASHRLNNRPRQSSVHRSPGSPTGNLFTTGKCKF